MTAGNIEARNNAVDSSLTIDGNVSGDFVFAADFNGGGSDELIITGDVADGSSMSVVLNPTQQLSGETSFTVITVGGENHADAPIIAGVTGNFADTRAGAEASYSEATGEITVTARFGMGHMGTSAAVSDHAWRSTGGCSRSAASAGATCSSSWAWKIPECRCGPAYSRKKAWSTPPTICRTSASIRSSPPCTPASSGRVTSAAALQCPPDVQLRQRVCEPERQPGRREGRRFSLRPQCRLSVRQRPVLERDLAADGHGDRFQNAGYVVARDRQPPTPTAMASMSSWATRTS